MKQVVTRFVAAAALVGLGFLGLVAGRVLFAGQAQMGSAKPPGMPEPVPALTPYVETHSHFDEKDLEGSIRSALAGMGRQNMSRIFFLTLPDTLDHPGVYDAEIILPLVKKYSGKIAILGGGGSLNGMIIQSVKDGDAGPAVQKKFRERAEQLLREGVVGFGEMATEHFAGATPYEYAPADHPLYLLLADIAAQHDVPIDLHMEAVPKDMPLPSWVKSPPNPPRLHGNIAAFERLLSHNPHAKIIWAHAGAENTGYRTPDLCRRLLAAHPNLYMELKVDPAAKGQNYPLETNGTIKPDWLVLIKDFPDRFVIGTDQRYPMSADPEQRWQETILLFNQLPADVRRKVGTENAAHIYDRVFARQNAAGH